jgi:hypothetical protein
MAERNPNIPSERRMEVEERTNFNEDEANRRFAEKQAKIRDTDGDIPNQESAVPLDADERHVSESVKRDNKN